MIENEKSQKSPNYTKYSSLVIFCLIIYVSMHWGNLLCKITEILFKTKFLHYTKFIIDIFYSMLICSILSLLIYSRKKRNN